MKLIIAGSQALKPSFTLIDEMVESMPFEVDKVISGCCEGVDKAGERWAVRRGLGVKRFPPNWVRYGKGAGPVRNGEMAHEGDALLLIWDGESNGSSDMKRKMLKAGKPIYEVIIKTPEQVLRAESPDEAVAMELPFSGSRKGVRSTAKTG